MVLATCFSAGQVHAAEPARLEWVRLEGAGSCIDAAELETRVKRRLDTDPFDPRASRSIEGVARRTGEVWRAQIAVRAHPGDANPPLRELESSAADCESLSNAVVLAVALAVDPAAAFSDAAEEASPPPRPVEKASPPEPAIAASEPALVGRADLALTGQTGLLPQASLGVGLGVGTALTRRFELGLRARAFPDVEVSDDLSYAVGLFALTLELCAIARPAKVLDLRACGGPALGLLHAAVLAGDRTQPGERASLAMELGLDAAFALTRLLAFELGARAAVPVTRYRFTLEGSDDALFVQSAIAGIAHIGLELRFGVH
ncbi:MAG TPA: hypothetical protein VJN18_25325 [Polyangiaceae bacterium]|nr:hypothetical protein [Polyangiaceae bacterium]